MLLRSEREHAPESYRARPVHALLVCRAYPRMIVRCDAVCEKPAMHRSDGVAAVPLFMSVSSLDFGPLPHRGGLFSVWDGRLLALPSAGSQATFCATRFHVAFSCA